MLRLSRFGLLLLPVSLLGAATTPALRQAETALGRMPLRFEANQGQFRSGVRYAAHAGKFSLSLTSSGPSLTLDGTHRIDVSFLHSNPAPAIEGVDPLPARSNYFIGSRDRWRADVPAFSRVRYREVYAGIDLIYYGNNGQLEYDFVLAPGADPAAIRMRFGGAQAVRVNEAGDLVVDGMVQKRPLIYQESPRRPIGGRYVLLGDNTVGFHVDSYDRSRRLVIDPVLSYVTYIGGSQADRVNCAKVVGNRLYIAGQTVTEDLKATDNAYRDTNSGNADIFVAVIDITPGAGYPVTYLTYLGGGGADIPLGMDVDFKGIVYLTGSTTSTNFSLGGSVFQVTGAASTVDAFALQLDPSISGKDGLLFSSYLGGTDGDDVGNGVAFGPDSMMYVIGTTKSTDFPLTDSAYQHTHWGTQDAFITKIDPVAGKIVYSTYLGGEDVDDGRNILVGANGLVYFTASTLSDNFPMAGFQVYGSRIGAEDVIVGVMNLNLSGNASLVYATYYGGTGNEEVRGLAFDRTGAVVITGYTLSSDLPVTGDALQNKPGGNGDAFVAVIDPRLPFGQGLLYSTYFGGSSGDVAYGVAADSNGVIYVTGYTLSSDMPVSGSVPQAEWGGGVNVFVAGFQPGIIGKGAFSFSTYVGTTAISVPAALALDSDGGLYVAGYSGGGMPLTGDALQGYGGGASDGFIFALKGAGTGAAVETQQAGPRRRLRTRPGIRGSSQFKPLSSGIR